MDDTLIRVKSGAKFAKDFNDWELWHPSIKQKLKELYTKGFKILIISNQKGVSTGKVNANELKKKFENIQAALEVPLDAVMALEDDEFRKPN